MPARAAGVGGEQQGRAAGPAGAAVDWACLAGLRAVASIGVVGLHCFMYWQFFLSHQTKFEITSGNPIIKLASAGVIWVDVLLVLSAALAAWQLLPRLEDRSKAAPSCWQVVLGYWRRRAARILPAYIVANLLAALALGPTGADVPREAVVARWMHFKTCPANVWANALFVQNWLGISACPLHLWTVGLQVQFYAAFPLLLCALRPRGPGFRSRLLAALAAVLLGGTAWRLWAAWSANPMEMPVGDFAVDKESQISWANMAHASYLPTAGRLPELAAGAALGLLLRSPGAIKALRRWRHLLSLAAFSLQATYLHLLWYRHLLFRAPRALPWPATATRLQVALLVWGSPFVSALVVATLLALMLHSDPVHELAARVLAAPTWRPLAEISYTQFLIHEQARLWLLLLLPSGYLSQLIVQWPLPGFAVVCMGTLAAGYACALPLNYLVAKPFYSAAF